MNTISLLTGQLISLGLAVGIYVATIKILSKIEN